MTAFVALCSLVGFCDILLMLFSALRWAHKQIKGNRGPRE